MNNPLINPGIGTFVWMLVAFGLLAFILMKWGWPMILKSLHSREEAIAKSLNEAAKAREEMKQLVVHNEELMRKAKLEYDKIVSEARATAEEYREKEFAKIDQEVARRREAAIEAIENKKKEAITDLKNEIATFSIQIAEKLIRAELSDKSGADALIQKELELIELN